MLRRSILGATILALGLVFSGRASAHGMRTAYLEIVEHAPGKALVRLKTTIPTEIRPQFPSECEVKPTTSDTPNTNPIVHGGSSFLVHCPGSLEGRIVGVEGLGTTISEAVVWVSRKERGTQSFLLTPAEPTFRLPAAPRPWTSFIEYVPLGMKHILEGTDHLLFLLLLVFSLRRVRAVLWAETAFTISHGLSFSAAALGWIVVSKEAAEACIAASLLLLALDIERKGISPPTTQSGAALALVFGLVHGLGFAGGLTELGFPAQDVGWALLGFGTGVEIGQVLFLAVALGIAHVLSRSRFYFQSAMIVVYAAGGLAAFWFIERVVECFSAARLTW